jgi:hypothetical protein
MSIQENGMWNAYFSQKWGSTKNAKAILVRPSNQILRSKMKDPLYLPFEVVFLLLVKFCHFVNFYF